MLVSILVPVYNEQYTIEPLLKKVLSLRIHKEVIVIDDGSIDQTKQRIKKFASQIKLITHPTNRGKGSALRSGLKLAQGQVIVIQDADLEYNPADIKSLLEPFKNPKTLVVYGSRLKSIPLTYHNLVTIPLPIHFLANKFLTFLTSILYGKKITDMETGFKAIDRVLMLSLKLSSNKFDIEPEITAKLLRANVTIVEVPIVVKPRSYDEGKKITFKDGLIAIWTLIKYRLIS